MSSSSSSSSRGKIAAGIQSRAQEVAREDYEKARALATDAAKSGAYLYPFKGIVYFLTNRALWKPFASRVMPVLGLSAAVVTGMFTFAYLPQLALLVFVNGPLAVFSTVLLVLSESATIVSLLSRNFMMQDALLDTFDGTMLSRNEDGIVKEGRQVRPGTDPIARLGKVFKSPFEKFSPKALVRYVMYLPLNFIPVVGTVIFIALQGRARGRVCHERYFQLKEWPSSRRTAWLEEHVAAYTAFGTIATFLEMIPFVSIFFAFTNAVGAALWAADIEEKNSQMGSSTAPNLREAAKRAE